MYVSIIVSRYTLDHNHLILKILDPSLQYVNYLTLLDVSLDLVLEHLVFGLHRLELPFHILDAFKGRKLFLGQRVHHLEDNLADARLEVEPIYRLLHCLFFLSCRPFLRYMSISSGRRWC